MAALAAPAIAGTSIFIDKMMTRNKDLSGVYPIKNSADGLEATSRVLADNAPTTIYNVKERMDSALGIQTPAIRALGEQPIYQNVPEINITSNAPAVTDDIAADTGALAAADASTGLNFSDSIIDDLFALGKKRSKDIMRRKGGSFWNNLWSGIKLGFLSPLKGVEKIFENPNVPGVAYKAPPPPPQPTPIIDAEEAAGKKKKQKTNKKK